MTSSRRTVRRSAVAVTAAFALLFAFAPHANAEPVDVSFVMTYGEVGIDPEGDPLVIPVDDGSAGISGTWDDETGQFDGTLIIPAYETIIENEDLGEVDIIIDFADADVTGTIDPETGEIALSTVVNVEFQILSRAFLCDLGPIALDLTSDAPGFPVDFDADPVTFGVAQDPFSVPEAICVGRIGGAPAPTATAAVNENLSLPTDDAFTLIEFEAGDLADPTPIADPPADNGDDNGDDEEPEEIVEIIEIIEPAPAQPTFTG